MMLNEKIRRRFFSKVSKTPSCWLWSGAATPKGYGKINIEGTTTYAHRVSWHLHYGLDPDKKFVLHRCDNPRCVNPDHLFLGDYSANSADMKKKDRHTRGERSGVAKLSDVDVKKIRQSYAPGKITMEHLAREHGVSRSSICLIIHRKNWAHLHA